uniref:ADAM metallopeptidase domain 28 n=1 Tax=Periophthalmus magnuspinnatus TaxID=409849 RepID=A0A3B4APK0_9GOBI
MMSSQDHCYYQGKIVGNSASEASISTCDGLRGYFRTSEQRFLIEPLTSDPEGDHAVFGVAGLENATPAVCGVTNETWAAAEEPPSRTRSGGGSILDMQKYMEFYIVADNKEYIRMSKDVPKLRKRIFEVVNFVNMVYKPLLTFVALVGLEIWTDADKITLSSNTEQNLDNFMNWRNKNLINKKHDCAHLISGIDFAGDTIGLAFVGALCTGFSVGVVQDYTDTSALVGATLAHELGHNLGMSHDTTTCKCSADSCIMEATVNAPKDFSTCSRSKYEEFLLSRGVDCLLDKPDYKTLVSPPVCGNGFVEAGEQCDCGTVKECTNCCCNASTCAFSEGSQCAEGECCEDCKILGRSRECRRKRDECDLAEYCDGASAVCPEDVFSVNGLPCDNTKGFCYNGECPQRSRQCNKMYGPGAIEGRADCFQINTVGQYYGYCKRPSNTQYIACPLQDIYCGKLFCHNGTEYSTYGGWLKVGDCKASHFADFTKDYGQVETGTKCAAGKVCIQNQCVDLETAYKTAACSAKCPGRSLCNHRGECQCEPGWLPPYCDKEDKTYSSVTVQYLSPGWSKMYFTFIWKPRVASGKKCQDHFTFQVHFLFLQFNK